MLVVARLSFALLFGGITGCKQKSKPAPKKTEPAEKGAGDGPNASNLPDKPADFTDLGFMRREEPQEFYKNVTNGKVRMPKFNDPEFMMKEKSKDFYEVLTNGKKPMPSFKKKLTADQRWSVIDYLWTFVYSPAAE